MTLMLDEILQEPDSLMTTYEKTISSLKSLASQILKSDFVVIAGSGTSYHASIFMNYLLLQSGVKSVAIQSSEFSEILNGKLRGEVTSVIFSQSGESTDALSCLHYSKELNFFTAGITNSKDSTLASESDLPIVTEAGDEKSIAATKSHSVQLLTSAILSSVIKDENPTREVELLVKNIRDIIGRRVSLERKAKELKKKIVFLASGYLFPVALEGELKFKETSGILAESYAIREYLHGPIHNLDKDTSVILLNPHPEKYTDVLDRLKYLSGNLLYLGPGGDFEMNFDLPSELVPIAYLTSVQLLANYFTERLGLNPDKPSNLTKVVR